MTKNHGGSAASSQDENIQWPARGHCPFCASGEVTHLLHGLPANGFDLPPWADASCQQLSPHDRRCSVCGFEWDGDQDGETWVREPQSLLQKLGTESVEALGTVWGVHIEPADPRAACPLSATEDAPAPTGAWEFVHDAERETLLFPTTVEEFRRRIHAFTAATIHATEVDETGRTSMRQQETGPTVARMFTHAIEKTYDIDRLGDTPTTRAERNRARHEAIAQHMLAYLLDQEGQLELFIDEFELGPVENPRCYREWPEGDMRFDHVIDSNSEDDWTSVCIIEDKIGANLGNLQVERYADFLEEQGENGLLLLLHPIGARGERFAARLADARAQFPTVRIESLSWQAFAQRMSRATQNQRTADLYHALASFAETVGTGFVEDLAPASVLEDGRVHSEVHDIISTAQTIAAEFAGLNRRRRFTFSMHPGHPRPWLQFGMTGNATTRSLGLEIDLVDDPGSIIARTTYPEGYSDGPMEVRIGFFPNGKLSPAGHRRLEELLELAEWVRENDEPLDPVQPGRFVGRRPSPETEDALRILGAIFEARPLRNPLRGGATSRLTQGIAEGENNTRLGARLVNTTNSGNREARLFIGPPDTSPSQSCAIWIHTEAAPDGQEITPRRNESGRDYVQRVWATCWEALHGEGGAMS